MPKDQRLPNQLPLVDPNGDLETVVRGFNSHVQALFHAVATLERQVAALEEKKGGPA